MADIFTKEKRSEIMRKVKNRDTNIELLIRRALFKKGYRFRVKNSLIGKPDIIFPKQKVAIFCDGDFWHGRHYQREKKNYNRFWIEKIQTNKKRDIKVNKSLQEQGWIVLRFWKTEILRNPEDCFKKIKEILNKLHY